MKIRQFYYVTSQFVLRRCSVNVNKSTANIDTGPVPEIKKHLVIRKAGLTLGTVFRSGKAHGRSLDCIVTG
jgi:hypothetical protein